MHQIWKTKRIIAAMFLVFMVVGTIWATIELFEQLKKPVVNGQQLKAV